MHFRSQLSYQSIDQRRVYPPTAYVYLFPASNRSAWPVLSRPVTRLLAFLMHSTRNRAQDIRSPPRNRRSTSVRAGSFYKTTGHGLSSEVRCTSGAPTKKFCRLTRNLAGSVTLLFWPRFSARSYRQSKINLDVSTLFKEFV